MRIYSIIAFCLLLSFTLFGQEKTALFLGNSYTYSNGGVPQMTGEIAASLNDTLITDQNTPGGYTLQQHSENATSLSKIAAQNWDFVVLQEQSQMPSFPPAQVEADVYPYAEILCDSIYANDTCTNPMFFMTWGRENGDQDNCPYYEPLCTYEGMQLRLRESYIQMALDNDASVAPVGMVWRAIREDFPDIDLYSSDESHPSLAGTYLASCVFYTGFFHNSPVGAYIPDGLNETQALHMQEYASNIVFDSLDTWQIDTTHVHAYFIPDMPIGKSLYGYFSNESENAEICFWDFGDGSPVVQSPGQHETVEHVFPEPGWYQVCLTAWKGCENDTYCNSVHTDFFNSKEDVIQVPELIFDAQNQQLKFSSNLTNHRIWIYDSKGTLIGTEKLRGNTLGLSQYKGFIIITVPDANVKTLRVFVQ